MKVIYKLPKYLALIVSIVTGLIIIHDIRTAQSRTFFDLVELNQTDVTRDVTILGIDAYVFLMLVGLFFTIILAVLRRDFMKIKPVTAIIIAILFFLQAYLGAKILYGIEQVISDKSFDAFSMGGQSLYGTIFISFVFIPILAKILRANIREVFDYIAPFWAVLLVFVRLGCFIIGCCGADACWIGSTQVVLPVQLFEVVIDLLILQIVFNYENVNYKKSKQDSNNGNIFFIMIAVYGVCRFVLEFIRNNAIIWMGMTFGQFYSIICVIIAINIIGRKGIKKTSNDKSS